MNRNGSHPSGKPQFYATTEDRMESPKVIETRVLKTDEVQKHSEVYPRAKPNSQTISNYVDSLRGGAKFPPISLDANGLVLLDGYHRWKAYKEVGQATIEAELVNLNGFPRKLYAAQMNAIHGDRLSSTEKQEIARQAVSEDWVVTEEALARIFGVSQQTMSNWVSDIKEARRYQRNAQIWWLSRLGWTQEEIGEKVGLAQSKVGSILSEIPELVKGIISESSRGRSPETIAQAHELPLNLVVALLLDGKSDAERMAFLKVGIQPYDVWNFTSCHSWIGSDYPGRIPGEIVLHTLYFFTKPGDTVLDPMVGSGTTIDACAYMGRKCYGYDAYPSDSRSDIIQTREPTNPELFFSFVGKPDLIFWDPPYFKKKDEDYGDASISKLDRTAYLAFFRDAIGSLTPSFKGKIAFLCSDYNEEDKPEGNIFYWEYVRIFENAGFQGLRRIQVPLTTQQVHPDIVNKFREGRRLARLNRDLVVFARR